MVHTVGLFGANGRIGSQVLPYLVKAHHDGTIKLVVLTRPGSKVKGLDGHGAIEVREVDLEDAASLDAGLRGVNVTLAPLSISAVGLIGNIVDALGRSSDAITLIPPLFATRFFPADAEKFPALQGVLDLHSAGAKHAEEKGVGQTIVLSGIFHDFFFDYKFVNVDLKGNKVEANASQLKNPFPITNTEDLAKALADIVVRDPHSIRDKTFSVISHWVTGNEMVQTFTKIHGSKTEVIDYDKAAEDALLAGPFGPVPPAYKHHWEKGPEAFGYDNQLNLSGRSFEQTARDTLRNDSA